MRARIQEREAMMRQSPYRLDPAEACPLFHHFLPGLYIRERHIPADIYTVGKIHKFPTLNFLTKGERITLVDNRLARIKAPFCYWSPPGNQRISYTVTDSVWVTQHFNPGDEHDTDLLERIIAADTEEDYQEFLRFLEMEVSGCLS